MRSYLIAGKSALPAIQTHFQTFPDDEAEPTPEELEDLVRLAFQFVPVADLLIDYALALTGRPWRN